MFKFNNTHIFTGYLKQKLASVNLPTCKIYTREFAEYVDKYGTEDPRVIESIDSVVYSSEDKRVATSVNYLKNNELYNYVWNVNHGLVDLGHNKASWKHISNIFYDSEKRIPGLTKTLSSPGRFYDTATHEYLGEYLRFLRDYYDINLMSLYNCFNNTICNNINLSLNVGPEDNSKIITFDSQDSKYKIYAIPVKLFANYTIAIDSFQGIELFCGLYNTTLDTSSKALELIKKTYVKENSTFFKQPFPYTKLDVSLWGYQNEIHDVQVGENQETVKRLNNKTCSRWDIANKEQDLKLFIKVPASCKSSIVILEGDFRFSNNTKYALVENTGTSSDGTWAYKQNHLALNFNTLGDNKPAINLNETPFTPISKLQLLEFNTGESYPFADRLIEYLSGSAITPIDEISDNIKRAQRVMRENQHYFKIEGIWEAKMQKIIYDYIMNSGRMEVENEKVVSQHRGKNPKNYGYQPGQGHTQKSTVYDILGYIDRDAEKWYASWKLNADGKPTTNNTIQNVDIYDNLYDL